MCGIEFKAYLRRFNTIYIEYQVFRRFFHNTKLTIWHKILCEAFLFIRHEPSEVWLVFCIHSSHKLDVWSILVGKVAIPCLTKVAITPRPLLLARTEMVGSHMQHTALSIVLISALEIEARIHTHIRSWHLDITIVGYVDTCRIVHLIICTCGYRERRYRTFTMVEYGIDIRWEYRLIFIVDSHGWICPPKECLWHIGAIV